MATAGDGRATNESGGAGRVTYESGGVGEKFQINEEPQNVSQEAGRNNSTGVSELSTHQGGNFASIAVSLGKSELEQMLKQMNFTRVETQRLIAVLHSRTIEESSSKKDGTNPSPSSPLLRLEASTSGSLKKHKLGDERDNFHIAGLPTTQMASPQHPTTIENLPDELLINIFMCLLAKQLAQMRSVSKSWNALLYQSSFIKSHLHHSIQNNEPVLLVFYFEDSSFVSRPFTAHLYQSPHLKLADFIKLPVNPQSEYTRIRVVGSVNGLICSSYDDDVIQIWNPSLSVVLTLPPYAMPSHGHNSIRIYFRFGFDPKTNDYKVVKLTGLIGPSVCGVKWWLQVEVYSMRKGSWELITPMVPSHITKIIDKDYVCVDGRDGHLHWLGLIGEKMDSKTIVAFDLGSETFREIPFPISIVDPTVKARSDVVGVLGGKLCVISKVRRGGLIEVWVMDEYGVAESWVKRHSFSEFDDYTHAFGFTLRNEFLFEGYDFQFGLYDPVTNKARGFENYCSDIIFKVVEYVDSLVWVTPAERP